MPELVSAELRQRIVDGELRPGPLQIGSLAREFSVSAVPVREALRLLEAEGLVRFEHGKRVVVNQLSSDDLDEIFDMRIVLERLLLERAVPLLAADSDALGRLAAVVDRLDTLSADRRAWRDTNRAFHMQMYEVVPMPRLKGTVHTLWNAVEPYIHIYAQDQAELAKSQGEHRQLLTFIRDGDTTAVMNLLTQHIDHTRQAVYPYIRTYTDGL